MAMLTVLILLFAADGLDALGGSGWVGAGLLGSVLLWIFFKHLPDKDKQMKHLIDDHNAYVKWLIEKQDASNEKKDTVLNRVIDTFNREQEEFRKASLDSKQVEKTSRIEEAAEHKAALSAIVHSSEQRHIHDEERCERRHKEIIQTQTGINNTQAGTNEVLKGLIEKVQALSEKTSDTLDVARETNHYVRNRDSAEHYIKEAEALRNKQPTKKP
jgi:hypothetical protein